MSRYEVRVKRSALKALARLPKADVKRVRAAIYGLADEPRPRGCKKLEGFADLWRVRVGRYRVIYAVEDDVLTVAVLEVGHRRDVYR